MEGSRFDTVNGLRPNSIQALSDIAYNAIRDAILEQQLQPGEHLVESDLAVAIGVSRTPLREAMRELEADGFVTILPRKGSYVAKFDIEEANHLFDARVFIESFCAERAARMAAKSDIAALEEIFTEESSAWEKKDSIETIELDNRFHMVIAEITRNPYIIEILKYLQKRNVRYRALQPFSETRMERVYGEHKAILDAIAQGDAKKAADAMNYNVESARQVFLMAVNQEKSETGS